MNKNIITAVAVVVIAILGYFGWQMWQGRSVELDSAAVEEFNPFAAEEPENPFKQGSNPYENIKTNPFE